MRCLKRSQSANLPKKSGSCQDQSVLVMKTFLHREAQRLLLQRLPPGEASLEQPFPEVQRIADLFWRPRRIVFEVQCSPISLQEAKRRQEDYTRCGCHLVWILAPSLFFTPTPSPTERWMEQQLRYFFTVTGEKIFIYDQLCQMTRRRRLVRSRPLRIDPLSPGLLIKQRVALEAPIVPIQPWKQAREAIASLFYLALESLSLP